MSTGKPEQRNLESDDSGAGLNLGRSDREKCILAMAGHFKLPAALADELVHSSLSEDQAAQQLLRELENRQPDLDDPSAYLDRLRSCRPEVSGEWDLAGLLSLAYWVAALERAEAGLSCWSLWTLDGNANRPWKPSDPGRVLSEVYEAIPDTRDREFGEFVWACRKLFETRVDWPPVAPDSDCPDPEAYRRAVGTDPFALPVAWGKIDAGAIRTILENRGLLQPPNGADAPGLSNRDVPELDQTSDDWIKRREAANHLGLDLRTLQNRAGQGRRSPDRLSGVDTAGIQWRKPTESADCWYYKPTLKPTHSKKNNPA